MNTRTRQAIPALCVGKRKPRRVVVNGKSVLHTVGDSIYFDCIADAGWILITSIGAENLYFSVRTECGEVLPGWCKCL